VHTGKRVKPVRNLRSRSLSGQLLILFPRRPTILDSRRRVAKEDSRMALDREAREADSWRRRRTQMEETTTHIRLKFGFRRSLDLHYVNAGISGLHISAKSGVNTVHC
jgi:hypothetical protein